MIHAILMGLARIIAVFGFVVFVGSPLMDWIFGNGWEVAMRAYIRGTVAAIGMTLFEIRRFRRSSIGGSLNRR